MQMCQDMVSTSVEGSQYDAEERSTIIDDSMVGKSIAGPAQAKAGKLQVSIKLHYFILAYNNTQQCSYES